MRLLLINLVAVVLVALLCGGCAPVATNARLSSDNGQVGADQTRPDLGRLSEREKWSQARQAYSAAQREQGRKDIEAAVYYYEVALELLGSLDMAAIEIPTQRVLSFHRKVLQSYDRFLASVDKLPASAGAVAVREASSPGSEISDDELLQREQEDEETEPVVIRPNAPPLPEVPLAMNTQVAGQVNFFMNKGRNVMLRWMERAAYVFPRLRPILAEEGVPDDVLYLAMIESGLNPRAYSYAHAAGVWQFIPSTGRLYGLTVNSIYDERLHVEASTRAACRYLRKLHEQFGDWYLAFAAYNCGEMRVDREIRRSHSRDYWKLKRLPRQTRGYVPAYLAARAICENPTRYGFPPLPHEVPFECERVDVKGPYRLEHIAQAAGADPVVVAELNPEYKRGVTPSGTAVTVRLPRRPDSAFDARLAAMPKTVVKPTQTHRVRSGETLSSIARRYGTTVAAIKAQPENRRLKANQLRIGQSVVIPVPGAEAAPEQTATTLSSAAAGTSEIKAEVRAAEPPPEHEIVYTVHRGETIGKIGRELGVSVAEICRQNGIENPNVIQPGRKLRIRVGSAPSGLAQTGTGDVSKARTHTVQPGDTVWSIAQTYGQNVRNILSWNRLTTRSKIYPGQELIVGQY